MRIKRLVPIVLVVAFIFVVLILNRADPAVSSAEDSFNYLPVIQRPLNTPTPTSTSLPTSTATVTPSPTVTATPTATATNSPPGGCSICSYDAYNCSDFSTQSQAQSCHDYCFAIVGFDVHRLDQNNDGVACESLP